MGLLIDKRTSTVQEWLQYDSKLMCVLEEGDTELIAKSRLAQEIVESEMLELLIQQLQQSPMVARGQLNRIVVGAELRRWHAFKTLELFYSDLAALAMNMAHAERSKKFSILAEQAKGHLLSTGIGYVNVPLPAPQTPKVQAVEIVGAPRVLRCCIAFVNDSGETSGASDLFLLNISASQSFRVGPVILPPGAMGWNLYVGEDENSLRLANLSPLSSVESIVVTSELPVVSAPVAPPFGQTAQGFWLVDRTLWR
jgi:hypothetical protein